MMKIEIFDVALGQCAVIHCPNGKKIMIDAGHKSGEWWPSIQFYGQPFELLINGNFDEDHASDFPDVQKYCRIKNILRNPTVNSSTLKQLKSSSGGMGAGIQSLHAWMQSMEQQRAIFGDAAPIDLDLGEVTVHWFYNHYPDFTKTNDLSLAAFVSYGNFTILFPGDLEDAGWKNMLRNADFRAMLARATVLVASHHGRDNGRCLDMSKYFKPQAVIISDAGKQHATQETVGWYGYRTNGCKTRNGDFRKVFTTRCNGKITLDVDSTHQWWIGTGRNEDPLSYTPPSAIAALGLPSLASSQGIINGVRQQAISQGIIDVLMQQK